MISFGLVGGIASELYGFYPSLNLFERFHPKNILKSEFSLKDSAGFESVRKEIIKTVTARATAA